MSATTLERPAARASVNRRKRRRDRATRWLPLALIAAFAAVLALVELGTRSLWLDESATVAISAQHGSALWHAIARDGGNMLGYYLLLHALTGAFGHAPAVIRAPSVLGFVGTVVITYVLAERLFDRRAAIAAGLLTAVSVPLVFWGQDARSYALMTMFIAASFLALVALLEDPGSKRRWAAYAASIVLAMYMSFVAVLVVPVQLLVLLVRRGGARAVLSAVAIAGACCVPLAVLAVQRGSSQLFWVPPVSLKRIGELGRWLTSAGMPPNIHNTVTGTVLLVLSVVLLVAILAVVARTWRRMPWQVWLVVGWLLVPLLISIAESIAGQPIALARNSLLSLPASALLLGWGLTRPRVSPWLGVSAIGLLLALRAIVLVPSYGASSENWKAATAHVLRSSRSGDCVAFYPSDGRMAFGYYVRSRAAAPTPVLPDLPWGQTRPFVERYLAPSAAQLAGIEARCPRLWLVASHQGFPTGPSASRANYLRFQSLRARLGLRYPDSSTTRFGWASPVRVELFAR